jgi:hypothetical protein
MKQGAREILISSKLTISRLFSQYSFWEQNVNVGAFDRS